MAVFQNPVTYPVSIAQPVRIAGTINPPFRIINNNITGTVWISDNPGIQVGQGTPLHAGTSLQWEKKTELWAITDTADVSIIVTNEISDWQPDPAAIAVAIINSGVIIIDRPETLLTLLDDQSNIDSFGPYDVSRFNSLQLTLSQTGTGVNFVRQFSLVFTSEIIPDPALFPTNPSIVDIQTWGVSENLSRDSKIRVPISGKYVYLISQSIGAGTPAGFDISLIASNRTIPNTLYTVGIARAGVSAQGDIGNVFFTTSAGLGTGDNNMGQTAIYRGPCTLVALCQFAAPPGDSLILIQDSAPEVREFIGLNKAAAPFDNAIFATGTNNVLVRAPIVLWGVSVRVTFRNSSGAGGAAFTCSIIPNGPSY